MSEKLLDLAILIAAATLIYVTGEAVIRILQPWPKPLDTEDIREEEAEIPASAKFYWQVFPGAYFEILPEEDLEENFERFENWIHEHFRNAEEAPDGWWDSVWDRMESMLQKAVEMRQELELKEFRKSLEEL